MASACQSSCVVNDVLARMQPVRANYVNLYKRPESDAEFVRSISFDGRHGGSFRHHPAVVDSVSCRQLYLRSYTFSRKESVPEKTKKCLDRVRERVSTAYRRERKMAYYSGGGQGKKKYAGFGRAKEASCAAVSAVFRRLLSCTTKVDVVG
ncbi:hypothetical protein RHMOL_Rhmol13G0108300 [Rhododendron molle]|uniref:Uncharacterized protein n=1 Tax=Rhododendron molle TaxID=49168 RepID=A0ACC0L6L4_RHOML|nr:hypothetical protein RHMOL_Rhmol13G0108300 [Rhododendron molle]